MKHIALLVLVSVFLAGCSLPFLSRKQAALQVNSSPQSSVFLNGSHVGQTPYFDENLKPGDYTIKLQVDNQPDLFWEAQVNLNPSVVTVVDRKFGESVEKSSSYIIQLESLADENGTEISIITVPDNVIVKLDGQPEGFSPISLKDISEGDHSITLTAPGYNEETININVQPGFKMLISATLSRSQLLPEPTEPETEATESAELDKEDTEAEDKEQITPTPTKKVESEEDEEEDEKDQIGEVEKPYVVILETGTGWLRVRSDPNATTDNEVAKVDVGDKFPFVESSDTGWYKIEYEAGEEGWISRKYADLFE